MKRHVPYLLILPIVALMGVTIVYPFIKGIYMSFTDTNFSSLITGNAEFIGLGNYLQLLGDEIFRASLTKTIVWVVSIVLATLVVGLGLALLLNQDFPGRTVFRTCILLPWAVPGFVAAMSWKNLYSQDFGAINYLLESLGVIDEPLAWLSDPTLAFWGLVAVAAWRGLPFVVVTLLAGLQGVNSQLYEAAAIDGANALRAFRHVTLPALKKTATIVTILSTVWAVNQFEVVFISTRGGPARATEILPVHTYITSFQLFDIGYASAIATTLLLLLSLVAIVMLRVTGAGEGETAR